MITNAALEELIQKSNGEFTEELAVAFSDVARSIIKHKFKMIDEEEAITECVSLAFEKLPRFKSGKGKAYNYFTTTMLCRLRQLYRTR